MTITVHQPEYLPWLPFFDRIQKADLFVILDDVGYQKNGFINRNKVKTKDGWAWLTIPVQGRSPHKNINEVLIDNSKNWQKKQLLTIKEHYSNSPYFNDYYPFFEKTFSRKWEKISDLDIYLIKSIIGFLGITPKIEITSEQKLKGKATERLIDICKKFKADIYLAGPGGKGYMDLVAFEKADIKVVFQEFSHPSYRQQGEFLPGMSVIDLLFNEGPKSLAIIKNT